MAKGKPTANLRARAREMLIGLSFVNLAILPMWAAQGNRYVEPLPYRKLLLMVVLFGVALTGAAWGLRKFWRSPFIQATALMAFALFPLQGIALGLGLTPAAIRAKIGLGSPAMLGAAICTAVILAVVGFWRFRGLLTQAVATVLLVLSPLLVYSTYLAAQLPDPGRVGYRHYEAEAGTEARRPNDLRPVVLVILDEADYDMMFAKRPKGLSLPVLDDLASSSISFKQAYSSGRDTVISVPAMFMGTPLRSVRTVGRKLSVRTTAGNDYPDWMAAPNLFGDLRESGARVAVVGYYHPYCDHPTMRFAYCSHWQGWAFRGWEFEIMPFPLAAFQDNHLVRRLAPPDLNAARLNAAAAYRTTFAGIEDQVEQYASGYDFTFVHLNRPHPPAYPAAVVQRDRPRLTFDDYSERLRQADAYVGHLLRALRESHEDFVLIVTGDHGLRYSSWAAFGYRLEGFGKRAQRDPAETLRVPFMIHLSTSARGSQPAMPVSTLQVRSLIPRLMHRELTTEKEVVKALARESFDPQDLSLGESFDKHGKG
jgi:hypothetical protein